MGKSVYKNSLMTLLAIKSKSAKPLFIVEQGYKSNHIHTLRIYNIVFNIIRITLICSQIVFYKESSSIFRYTKLIKAINENIKSIRIVC